MSNQQAGNKSYEVNQIVMLRRADVERITGLSRSAIYQYVAENKFPRQMKLGARAVGWIESEVQDWLRQRLQERGSN
ncbi:helix-turn-helix transcriptional regulator [Paraburkholderia sediminicola]|uniref:helix-turn-helix transcriptional regulator n=1 Tax=Paraburkholderia sediminicola TaxID=458836 RepID=UPI0038BAF54C